MSTPIRVTVWNENQHEKTSEEVRKVYPEGIHGAIAAFLSKNEDMTVRTATLDMPEHGLTQDVLDNTDVLTWWGHMAHGKVSDEVVERVFKRVNEGMGLIVLHSGHGSKIFSRLTGCQSGNLRWRENNERTRLWAIAPGHAILKDVPDTFVIPREETYGEPFGIPDPDRLIFLSWSPGGEVFRSGCCFVRGAGHIFYFQPGHESFPTYYIKEVQQVITNSIRWAAPYKRGPITISLGIPNGPGLENS